jgi:nitric oxide reductase subunit B
MTEPELDPLRRHAGEPIGPADRRLRWGLFAALVAGFLVLIYGTVAAYEGAPPIPERVVDPRGATVYTRDDIVAGKAVFQRTDLMDFGSLYGNGAYFGPDFTTDYLARASASIHESAAQARFGTGYGALTLAQRAQVDALVIDEFKTNRYAAGVLAFTTDQVAAHRAIQAQYRELFIAGDRTLGLPSSTVRNVVEADQLTAFLGWTAWTTVANRPGESATYTNNWPYEPAVGNEPTSAMWTWTWVSLGALLVIGAATVVVYRRIFRGRDAVLETPTVPPEDPLTPSQRSTAGWFLLVPALLIGQGLLGTLMAHYYAERTGFFGIDLAAVLPFNVLKGWHLQLAIAWIAAAWLGAGLYLAPLIGGREPRRQRLLSNVLLVAVVAVVVGSSIGLWLGVKVDLGAAWFWVGNQGLEYIQLGRLFQIALFGGLLVWAVLLARAFWPGLRRMRTFGSVEALLLYSAGAIGLVYAFGMIPIGEINPSPTITDYWRWWVVHLWVENTFEFFTVAAIGYALLRIGLLSRRLVERVVYFELILIFGAGLVGTGHHFYWVGEPAMWLALGAVFGILEVIPLGILVIRAWQEYRAVRAAGEQFPQRTAFYFFVSASAWNFFGAGVLGGIINPPIVSYFEHGSFLTSAHGHASMFGAFGLLALGLLYFAIRGMVSSRTWSDRWPLRGLRLFNAAIALWLVLNLLPVGIAQLAAVVEHGYSYARSLAFYDSVVVFQWLRLPGDLAFLAGGAIVLGDLIAKLRHRRTATVAEGDALMPAVGVTPTHA